MVECTDRTPVATFFSADSFSVGATIALSDEAAHHIRVARVGVGECVALRDGAGRGAVGVLVKSTKSAALVDVSEIAELPKPAPIHLLAPVADRERMLWLAEKVTELGVSSWRPVIWRRSKSVTPRGEGPTFQAKVKARMIAALIQSGAGWVHNTSMLEGIEKAVMRHPITAMPKPAYSLSHRSAHALMARMTALEERGSWAKVPAVLAAAMRA